MEEGKEGRCVPVGVSHCGMTIHALTYLCALTLCLSVWSYACWGLESSLAH